MHDLVATHPIYIKFATLAISLFELALEGMQSGKSLRFSAVGEAPALILHDRVTPEEVLICVDLS